MSKLFDKTLNTHYQEVRNRWQKNTYKATAVAQWTTAAKLITL